MNRFSSSELAPLEPGPSSPLPPPDPGLPWLIGSAVKAPVITSQVSWIGSLPIANPSFPGTIPGPDISTVILPSLPVDPELAFSSDSSTDLTDIQAQITALQVAVALIESGGNGANGTRDALGNKSMVALETTEDFQRCCSIAIAQTPARDGYVRVFVNGTAVELGDGARDSHSYFSNDNGATARLVKDIEAGDFLYWVGSNAGYELAGDLIDFDYQVVIAT